MNLKKELGGVADAVSKIMDEALKGDQHKIDANKNNKIDAHDFKLLRSKKKVEEAAAKPDFIDLDKDGDKKEPMKKAASDKKMKEEVDQIDELSNKTLYSYLRKTGGVKSSTEVHPRNTSNVPHDLQYQAQDSAKSRINARKGHGSVAPKGYAKEEVEQIAEYKSTGGVYKNKGTYGTEKSLEAGYTDYDKENELAKKNLKTKKPKKYGARQNFVRSTRVNESFTSILASYKENGLKGISEMFATEQASQEEYDKEIEKAKAKSQGKDKAEVAKASVQAVKSEQTHTKIEVIDMSDPYNIQKREIDLEERKMSDDEMEKKEDIVKGMKKGMKGFKERYGERAKEVMYATATKRAMGEEVEQIEEGTPEGYQRRDGRLIPKIHSKMTPHEHGYDYTMQSIEDAPSKAKIHSQHKEIVKDNPHPQGSKEHKDWEAGTNKAKADHLKDFS